jgi:hypothetical protein
MAMIVKPKERAVFLRGGAHDREALRRGARLYIGDEFCERRLPSNDALERWRRIGALEDDRITLVTPPLTGRGLARALEIVARLVDRIDGRFEVVVNDWGLLKSLRERPVPGLELVLGRLLSSSYARTGMPGGKTVPKALLRELPPLPFFRSGPAKGQPGGRDARELISDEFSGPFLRFLLENRIKGVEFNFIRHLLAARGQLRRNSLKAHVYWPYAFLAWSRYCSCAVRFKGDVRRSLSGCRRECETIYGIARPAADAEFTIRGNAYLIRQSPSDTGVEVRVDRLIEDGLF